MFENLIESKKKGFSSTRQTIMSVVAHVVVIFAAVKATTGAAENLRELTVRDHGDWWW